MKRYNWFPKTATIASLIGALFVWSCSEAPAPGPIAPINPTTKPSQLGKVRPLLRKSDDQTPVRHSLAKGAYTDDQLIAQIKLQPALSSVALKTLLLSESSLSAPVLMAVLNRYPLMPSGDLKAVLLANTPLPAEIVQTIQLKIYLLSGSDLKTVLEAQAGFSQYFSGTTVSKWISSLLGGEIWHGGHKVKFPPGALSPYIAQAFIRIVPSNFVEVDFGPDSFFKKAVEVTISYKNVDLAGIDKKSLTIAYYDEAAGQWQAIASEVDLVKQAITAKVFHFSKYALAMH